MLSYDNFFDNYVFLLGGYNGTQSIDTVERYDFVTKKWDDMKPMLTRRTSLDSVLLIDNIYKKDSYIFVVGGIQNGIPITNIDVYNIRLNKWEKHGSLIFGRSGSKCF